MSVISVSLAAVALAPRLGQTFSAVVTGATPKGVFVRVLDPPVEGRVIHGEEGLDVGDRLRVKLIGAELQQGKLIASQSRDRISGPHACSDPVGYCLQERVPDRMA